MDEIQIQIVINVVLIALGTLNAYVMIRHLEMHNESHQNDN